MTPSAIRCTTSAPGPNLDGHVHGIYHSNVSRHVWKNVVYRCAGFGLQFFHGASAVTVANNTVFNNAYSGVYIVATSNVLVTNNIGEQHAMGDRRGIRDNRHE